MLNILLNSKCTRSCPYCFARSEMDNLPDEILSWENLTYIADFLQASHQPSISLLGGEPTLHPNFVDYVLYLLERNFKVNIFTNGIMSPIRLKELEKHLSKVPIEKLSFVCNLNNPYQTDTPQWQTGRVHEFLIAMGPWTQPGFNIYRPDFDIEFLFDLVDRCKLKRMLRLGLAHPVPGSGGLYIKPVEIGGVIERLFSFQPLFENFQLEIRPDCGFPLCKFTDTQLGWLFRSSGADIRFKCGPAIDITPDMNVYSCFPLSTTFRRSIYDFDNLEQVKAFFALVHANIRGKTRGIYPECGQCKYLTRRLCSGGGVCQILNNLACQSDSGIAEIESESQKTSLPV